MEYKQRGFTTKSWSSSWGSRTLECGHLSCYLLPLSLHFFSPFYPCLWLWGNYPWMKQLLTQRELFFCPCSTVRAVDYEILWSNLSPQASVNISWHMGERNPHSLGAGLPLAKVSTTIRLHSKRNNEGKRFLRAIILTIWVLMALMCWREKTWTCGRGRDSHFMWPYINECM